MPITDIIVTNALDVVNGDISSPAALLNNPGPDGISLREAIEAANNASEPQAISFAGALSGATITPTFPLVITRDGTTLTGLADDEGQPSLALDASEAPQLNGFLYILASDVTVRRLRLVGQGDDGISVLAGRNHMVGSGQPQPRQEVRNVVIEDNVFVDTGGTPALGSAVRVYMEPEAGSIDASIENVRIIRNTFLRYSQGVGVDVAANGSNCRISDVVIADNTFERMKLAVGVETAQGSGNQVLGTKILHNTFAGGYPQPTLFVAHLVDPKPPRGTENIGSLIDGTVIDGNTFSGAANVSILGGQDGASGCIVSDTEFVNNVMSGGSIDILAGKWEATGGRIDGLRFMNNTLETKVQVATNTEGGSGNSVSGLTFLNTIFSPQGSVMGVKPAAVSYSLIGYGGRGNKPGDPRFVNHAQGDFHLLAGSPAIDAGTADGAPATDIECRPRVGAPDIGAYEFEAPAVARLVLTVSKGRGTVSHSPVGFECGSVPSFLTGSAVNLVADPSPGWIFSGWSGDADCLDGTVTMTADRYCTATFARPDGAPGTVDN